MKYRLNEKLVKFLSSFDCPIYLVGGFVRDFLIDKDSPATDVDVCGPIDTDSFLERLNAFGGEAVGHYKRTHTVVFKVGGTKCEFTSFRQEIYADGGGHTPVSTFLTDDIVEDAKRRDFKCNAVYYDVKNDRFVDVLGGIDDIKARVLDTVVEPEKVFAHDGLRLMRLARFCGELNFTPTDRVLKSARACADNIKDISPERIYTELNLILSADRKHSFSASDGHYRALKILDETRVLDRIIPELTSGRGMQQRADFHNHDVLEHSLRAVLYAPPTVRLCALLHDVGKPYCKQKFGKYYAHDMEGKRLVLEILNRLKAPEEIKRDCAFITEYHMLDMREDVREAKLRRFFVKNSDRLDKLIAIKIADYRATKDYGDKPKTVEKWQRLLAVMQNDGTPFTLRELNLSATDLMTIGFRGKDIGETLDELWDGAIINPQNNEKERLTSIALLKLQSKH